MVRTATSLGLFESVEDLQPLFAQADAVTCIDFHSLPGGSYGSITENMLWTKDAKTDTSSRATNVAENATSFTPPSNEEAPPDDMVYTEDIGAEKNQKRPAYTPIPRWLTVRDAFLLEFLRREGRGEYAGLLCPICDSKDAVYRCKECFSGELLCQQCIVDRHLKNPLHNIEEWTKNTFFQKTSLKKLGLVIQLGHMPGHECHRPKPPHGGGFVVIDIYGIHEVELRFCSCESEKPPYIQLLRYGLYPASTERPQTAATFNLLKFFQLLNFESKASLYEFYQTLVRWSDNTGTDIPRDRYQAFIVMVREFNNLKTLKRGGRGHHPDGIAGTRKGELAVLCPACPQPRINMLPGWEKSPRDKRYLHSLFLAIDANFRLKRRNVSNEKRDPSLGDGWSYFVPQEEYNNHIEKFKDIIKQPKSTCSEHTAINKDRIAPGFAVTGVVAVSCARHDMRRALGVGDLQRGERFVNTDFVFLSSLSKSTHLNVVASYDVICQWDKHVWDRMDQYPEDLRVNDKTSFQFLVPKFHLPSHIVKCQTRYSFNFAPGVGRTDGEAPERGWSQINPIAPSSTEMGPGTRRDFLDAHFGDSDWKKVIHLVFLLKRKFEEAAQESEDYRILHNHFALGFDRKQVKRWEKELNRWERDQSKENPFEKKQAIFSLDRVRKCLAREEKVQLEKGETVKLHEQITAVKLIALGIDLEGRQREVGIKQAAKKARTTARKTALREEEIILHQVLMAWIDVQHLYAPGLHALRNRENQNHPEDKPETPIPAIKLHLPSSVVGAGLESIYDKRLLKIEHRLRCAQANDALNELRNSLRLRTYVYRDKDDFRRGQRQNTRSRDIVNRLEQKVSLAASNYRIARKAISSLATALQIEGWKQTYPPLLDGDIRPYADDDLPFHMKAKLSVTQKRAFLRTTSKKVRRIKRQDLSWIWQRPGAHPHLSYQDSCTEDLRIEFCKSKARADRWKEEFNLLQEEMRRTKRFFINRASMWNELAEKSVISSRELDPDVEEGLRAYALEQASMYVDLNKKCEEEWAGLSIDD